MSEYPNLMALELREARACIAELERERDELRRERGRQTCQLVSDAYAVGREDERHDVLNGADRLLDAQHGADWLNAQHGVKLLRLYIERGEHVNK